MTQTIAYVGPFNFPSNSAQAIRVAGISLSLLQSNTTVKIGCGQSSSSHSPLINSPLLQISDLRELQFSYSSKLYKLWHVLTCGEKTLKWVNNLSNQLNAVLLYGGRSSYLLRLIKWCRVHRVPPIVDVVEWYDPHHVLGGAFGPFHLNSELSMRYLHVRAKNLIVISRYLAKYYNSKGCRTVRIPPVLDVMGTTPRLKRCSSGKPLCLAYTGVPGKKDLLNNVFEALIQLDPDGDQIQIFVAGPTIEDLLKFDVFKKNRLRYLPGCIKALGKLSHSEALNLVREADFTVLLRPPLRYAQAGFPTKVPESLTVGTPVICNLTSDLGDYIHDEKEGLICRNESVEVFRETLERAVRITPEQKESMRRAARAQAEISFDFRNYSEVLNDFIQNAIPI